MESTVIKRENANFYYSDLERLKFTKDNKSNTLNVVTLRVDPNTMCIEEKLCVSESETGYFDVEQIKNEAIEIKTEGELEDLLDCQNENASPLTINKEREPTIYRCRICSYTTKYQQSFIDHTDIHRDPSDPGFYKCYVCGQQTKQKAALHMHMLTHKDVSDVTSYKCEFCPYASKMKEELKTHMLTHKSLREELPGATTQWQMNNCQPSSSFVNLLKKENFGKLRRKIAKALCPICLEDVGHFARHLFRKHSDEETVKKIIKMPHKSNERRTAIILLRRKGNYILNEQKQKFRAVRIPNKFVGSVGTTKKDYFPCIHCLGYFKKSYLRRHKKNCISDTKTVSSGYKMHLSESQTFLATTRMRSNFLNKSRIKKQVFNIMRPDDISFAAKTDPLICLFGESYISKHKSKQMNNIVSNKMRELGRLKLALTKSSSIEHLIDALKPECYELVVAATKVICGYNAENKTFKSSSLALNFGTTLKFLCDIAKKAILTKNPFFSHIINREEKISEIKNFRNMINMYWGNDVFGLANKVLNKQIAQKTKLLCLTEDVKAFNLYIQVLSKDAYENLKNDKDVQTNYNVLIECTFALVLVYNRKRVSEVQFLDIATYKNSCFPKHQEECLTSLSELEKNMCSTFKCVVVFGKGSKPVPILFTKLMQKYIDLLLTVRKKTQIISNSNIYVFANPTSQDGWINGTSVLRKFAHKCGAKNPELLTSTRFRIQIATISQLMNFEKNELEQIARFMGYTDKNFEEFYRLTDDTYQIAKVAKILLLLNVGKGSEFKGKDLNKIEIDEYLVDYDIDDKNDENEDSIEMEDIENVENKNKNLNEKQIGNVNKSTGNFPVVKISKRIRWLNEDKKLVTKYFKKHIQTKNAPRKDECLKFIETYPGQFNKSDWHRIKALVYNTYRDKEFVINLDITEKLDIPQFVRPTVSQDTTELEKEAETEEIAENEPKIEHTRKRNYKDKKDFCMFCDKDVLHFGRHLLTWHSSENDVQRVLSFAANSKDRRRALSNIRKRGNFIRNGRNTILRPVKRTPATSTSEKEDYLPCSYCFGFYKKRFLYRHTKVCSKNELKNMKSKRQTSQSDGHTTLIMGFSSEHDILLKKELFPRMRADEISAVIKKDFLICSYAYFYLKTTPSKGNLDVVRQETRRLARFLIHIQQQDASIKELIDVLRPCHFEFIVESVNKITVYNSDTKTYEYPTLAKNLSMLLKKCCDLANVHLLKKSDSSSRREEVMTLKSLLTSHWANEVFAQADVNLSQNKLNKNEINSDLTRTSDCSEEETSSRRTEQNYLNREVKKKQHNIKKPRDPWTDEQKKTIALHFADHIKNSQAPRKLEVQELLDKYPLLFEGKWWTAVKAVVFNIYTGKLKVPS